MTLTEAVPVAPALSRTVTVSVCGPSGVFVVIHGSVTCVADWLSDQTVAPAAVSVNVNGAVPGELIQMFAQVVPLTVWPDDGLVSAMASLPPPPPLLTVTVRVAVAVRAPASVMVRP